MYINSSQLQQNKEQLAWRPRTSFCLHKQPKLILRMSSAPLCELRYFTNHFSKEGGSFGRILQLHPPQNVYFCPPLYCDWCRHRHCFCSVSPAKSFDYSAKPEGKHFEVSVTSDVRIYDVSPCRPWWTGTSDGFAFGSPSQQQEFFFHLGIFGELKSIKW